MALPIAVLVSGGGSNLQSIIDRIEAGVLDAEIRLVFSNAADAYGLERAEKHGLPRKALAHTDFPSREKYDAAMVEEIKASGAEAVVLAGFMRLLSPVMLAAFPNRILNIHPAILPSFPGLHGQDQAADYGVRFSGCTVHFVDEKCDHGPIIIQAILPVKQGEPGDELAARILKLEHRIYPQAVQWLAQGRLSINGRHVAVEGAGEPAAQRADFGDFIINPPLEQGF